MGCDIHFFVEKRVTSKRQIYDESGMKEVSEVYWSKVGKKFLNKYFRPREAIDDWNEITTDEPYQGRNYTLFALLADVRNNHDVKPLSQPRGIPEDVSDGIKKVIEDWGEDGHSHSYYTLKELLDVDWDFTIVKQEGLVDPKNYELFQKTNRPYEWCQGTNQKDYKKVEWYTTLRDFCPDFIGALYEVRQYAREEEVSEDNIRFVFFFDN